jgi:hypothetical protein
MNIYEPHNRVDVTTPQGDGVIWLVTEYGHETDTMYTIILNDGQIWQFTHKDIVVKDNVTFNRVFARTEKPKVGAVITNRYSSSVKVNLDSNANTPCAHFVGDGFSTSGGKCLNCGHFQQNHIKTINAFDL